MRNQDLVVKFIPLAILDEDRGSQFLMFLGGVGLSFADEHFAITFGIGLLSLHTLFVLLVDI
jgi:hypothetical protein